MPAPNLYQLLELPASAGADELRQAFRQLSKRYHPDTTSLPEAEAAAAFRQLQQAYGVLSDPERRRHYDAQLAIEQRLAAQRAVATASQRPETVLRPLSGGEWLALLLLALAAVFALVLGVGLAWLRGVDLIEWPSWWMELP
jgi:curved DNA-binding protein CbpA